MGITTITAVFDGEVLVPETPLDAAPASRFDVVPQAQAQAQTPGMTLEDWLAFLESVEGDWPGRKMGEPYDPPVTHPKPKTLEDWKDYIRWTAGAWADFDGYEDPPEPSCGDEESFD